MKKSFINETLFLGLCTLFFNLKSQSVDTCYTNTDTIYPSSSSMISGLVLCNNSNSDSYHYAPDVVHYDHTPIKTFTLNFHFINDSNGDGNFDATVETGITGLQHNAYTISESIIYEMNYVADKNQQMSHPLNNNIPLIPDTRFRYELNQVLLYDDNDYYDYAALKSGSPFHFTDLAASKAANPSTEINVFFLQEPSAPSGSGVRGGIYWYTHGVGTSSIPAVFMVDLYHDFHENQNYWIRNWGDLLLHELGHMFGNVLHHSWTVDRNGFDCTDTPQGTVSTPSNNYMSYGFRGAWTPCQLGLMHWQVFAEWSSYIKDDYCERNESETITIETGEHITWNSPRLLQGDLEVESGASLKIKCLVSLPENGRIIVERGGKLILEGATLTNLCGDMWSGIHLWGNPNEDQFPVYNSPDQATLLCYSSTIEHALDAITTGKYDDNGFDWNFCGGASFYITNSEFRNCRRSIQMLSYHNKLNGYPVGNISVVQSTDFIQDEELNSSVSIFPWVTMWDVEGVQFRDCKFEDEHNSDPTHNAVYTINAGYARSG